MAAGEGRRLRSLTERWPKPVLPIDGRPVLATLLRELSHAGYDRVWLVTGHLEEQVRRLAGDGSAFGLAVRTVHQPGVLGSADAVNRALAAGAEPPLVVTAADTVFLSGDLAHFGHVFAGHDAAGALGVRLVPPPGPDREGVRVEDGLVRAVGPGERRLSAAPLWGIGAQLAERLCQDDPPHELGNAIRSALAAGEEILGVEIGKTRDLTDPLDLVRENFPYLDRHE